MRGPRRHSAPCGGVGLPARRRSRGHSRPGRHGALPRCHRRPGGKRARGAPQGLLPRRGRTTTRYRPRLPGGMDGAALVHAHEIRRCRTRRLVPPLPARGRSVRARKRCGWRASTWWSSTKVPPVSSRSTTRCSPNCDTTWPQPLPKSVSRRAIFPAADNEGRMHELGIAASVLDTVTAAAGEARASAVCVRVGALSGVDPGALRFSIEALIAGTDMEGLKLEIDLRPRTNRCRVCGVRLRLQATSPPVPPAVPWTPKPLAARSWMWPGWRWTTHDAGAAGKESPQGKRPSRSHAAR